MAGKPIGTIFCELDLDASKYTKAQQSVLKDASVVCFDIEKNYQTLGIKSAGYFDLLRARAENAYQGILHSASYTKEDIVRVEEAKNAKILALNEQQHGSHKSLFESIKSNWMAIAALATTVYMAVIKPIEAYMESEKALLKMGMAMKNQGDYTRAGLDDMEAFSKEIQRTTAFEDDATLAIMANMKSYGMSNEQVKLATRAALDLATAKENEGMTIERASEILGKSYLGITTGLKKLGIQVDENAKGSELFNSVMMQVEQRFGGSAQADLLTYSGQWKQLKNNWQDIQEFLGLVFLKTMEALKMAALGVATAFWAVVTGIVQGLAWVSKGLEIFTKALGLEKLSAGISIVSDSLQSVADSTKAATQEAARMTAENAKAFVSFNNVTTAIDKMGIAGKKTIAIDEDAAKAAKKAAQEKEAAIKKILEAIRSANITIESEGKNAYDKELIRIASEAKEYRKLGVDKITIAKFVAAETSAVTIKAQKDWLDKELAAQIEFNKQKILLNMKGAEQEVAEAEQTYEDKKRIYQKEFDERKINSQTLTTLIETAELAKDIAIEKSNKNLLDLELKAKSEYAKQSALLGKEGFEREIIEAEQAYREKKRLLEKEFEENKINAETLATLIKAAELEKNNAIAKSDDELAKKRISITRQMTEDIGKFTHNEYDLKKELLDVQYKDYAKFVVDKNLLDRWYEIQSKKLDEERILRSNDFFAGMKVAMDQNSRDQVAWGQVGADVFTKFTTDAQKQLSDNLFNFMTGRFGELEINWNSLWEGMLRTLTDKIAKMAVEAATAKVFDLLGSSWDWIDWIFAAKGIWDVKGAQEGIPVIAHPGEMIIPPYLARQIREAGGGESFEALQSMIDTMTATAGITSPGLEAFGKGTLEAYKGIATIGALMTATGKISIAQFMEGILSPQTALGAMIKGGLPALAINTLGLDKGTKYAYSIATMALMSAGVPGLLGILGGLGAMALTEAIMDALNMRQDEAIRDVMEEEMGWITSHLDIGKVGIYTAFESYLGAKYGYDPTAKGLDLGDLAGAYGDYGGWGTAESFGPSYGGEGEGIGFSGYGGEGEGTGFGDGGGYGGDGGGYGGEGGGGEGWKRGGIARGPESGYWARLHGTEQIIPLRGNRDREKGGGGGITINSPLVHIEGNLIADRQTFDEFVEKIDHALDKRSRRVYAS